MWHAGALQQATQQRYSVCVVLDTLLVKHSLFAVLAASRAKNNRIPRAVITQRSAGFMQGIAYRQL